MKPEQRRSRAKPNKKNKKGRDKEELQQLKAISAHLTTQWQIVQAASLSSSVDASSTQMPSGTIESQAAAGPAPSHEAFMGFSIDSLRQASHFSAWPLSLKTQLGLKEAHYTELTEVQKATLLPALCGRDILGAAKTGSGKTLAFLIPMLENLYKEQWTTMDGLGALILTPTRELAVQIFDVLRKVGAGHEALSAGLLIGGKNVQQEAERIAKMNILVATPGRLLQHMDETPNWTTDHLKILSTICFFLFSE